MNLFEEISRYIPCCEQEERDKVQMLDFIKKNPEDYLLRDNLLGHFSASAWVVNKDRTKVLMIYHNLYASWSWTGGHADGMEDMKTVAMKELREETGVKHAQFVRDDIFSLETLTVDGHVKKGVYVPSHLHFNITYLIEASEEDELFIKPDENQGVKWFTLQEVETAPTEQWMIEHIYKKLLQKKM